MNASPTHHIRVVVVALLSVLVTFAAGCGGSSEEDLAERARQADAAEERAREQERRLDELAREVAAERAREAQGARGGTAAREKPVETGGVLLSGADRRSFDALAAKLGGASGLAVSGLGRGQRPDVVGSLRTGPAWSTIKVPIAIAAQQRGVGTSAAARAAITASDNAAAEKLWAALGGPAAAGSAVEKVLAEAGDTGTQVQTQRVRPEFTAFGQTVWDVTAQQRFMAGVSCLDADSREVLDLMEQTIPAQRWGIGAVGPAQLKGGWGPDESGQYLVRQMGAVLLDNGRPLAMSILTRPADGSFESGTKNVTAIARWAVSHVAAEKLPRDPRC